MKTVGLLISCSMALQTAALDGASPQPRSTKGSAPPAHAVARVSPGARAQEVAFRAQPAAKKSKEKKDPVAEILERVQKLYDSTQDFEAEFIQIYTRVALSKTFEQRGTLRFKRPGMVRFDYEKPSKKTFVADGKQLFIYEPEEGEVKIQPNFKASELNTSLSFLWGEGELDKAFEAKILEKKDGAIVLELVPRKDHSFKKLILTVEEGSGRVTASELHETAGNTNLFRFRNLRMNAGIKQEVFQFTPPPGVEVIKLP